MQFCCRRQSTKKEAQKTSTIQLQLAIINAKNRKIKYLDKPQILFAVDMQSSNKS